MKNLLKTIFLTLIIIIVFSFVFLTKNYVFAFEASEEFGSLATSSTYFIYDNPPYATATYECMEFCRNEPVSGCESTGQSCGSTFTDFDIPLSYWFNTTSSVFATDTLGIFYMTRFDGTSTLGYVKLVRNSTSSFSIFFNCGELNNFQLCIVVSNGYCHWNYASSTCESPDVEEICGTGYNCRFCETQSTCNAQEDDYSYCEWQRDYAQDFADIWNEEEEYTSQYCLVVYKTSSEATTTFSQSYGEIRNIFANRVPFAYFFQMYDVFGKLTVNPSSTEYFATGTLLITFPKITHESTTVMSSFSINFIDTDFIFDIIDLGTWHTLRSLLTAGLVISFIFYAFKRIDKITQIHT